MSDANIAKYVRTAILYTDSDFLPPQNLAARSRFLRLPAPDHAPNCLVVLRSAIHNLYSAKREAIQPILHHKMSYS